MPGAMNFKEWEEEQRESRRKRICKVLLCTNRTDEQVCKVCARRGLKPGDNDPMKEIVDEPYLGESY